MRPALALMALLCVASVAAAEPLPPAQIEVTIEPQKFGDVAAILKVDSTVASFKFDQPVEQLALVLEAYPKDKRMVPVARLALELTKPTAEGRFCVQMADQGFIPLGNGAPHQMQLFLQLDCGGTLVSSSQSFLKEKFNFSKSLARPGTGTQVRQIAGHRVPVFWLMGNSDTGTYLTDEALDRLIAKNANDAYVLVAYLEFAKESAPPPVLATSTSTSTETVKPGVAPSGSGSSTSVIATVPSTAGGSSVNATKAVEGSSAKSAGKAKASSAAKPKASSSSAKTKKRSP